MRFPRYSSASRRTPARDCIAHAEKVNRGLLDDPTYSSHDEAGNAIAEAAAMGNATDFEVDALEPCPVNA